VPPSRHHRHLPRHRPGPAQLLDHRAGDDLQADRAKPEDLRNFIEEAAGISKYKERRRETENRIRRTHENLARLTDLREELERQLERLHRQAEAAKKYQEYKGEERQLKAQLSALRWQDLNDQVGQREAIIGTQEVSFERWSPSSAMPMPASSACATGIMTCPSASIWCRALLFGRRRHRPGRAEHPARPAASAPVAGRSERSRARAPGNRIAPGPRPHVAADPRRRAGHAHPEQEVTSAAAEEAAAALEESETTMHGWQEQWDTFNLTAAEPRRQAEVQQSRIQQLETSLERLADRQKRLGEERALLSATRKTRRSWRSTSSSPNPKRPGRFADQ
jgi:chromosome segregation protein